MALLTSCSYHKKFIFLVLLLFGVVGYNLTSNSIFSDHSNNIFKLKNISFENLNKISIDGKKVGAKISSFDDETSNNKISGRSKVNPSSIIDEVPVNASDEREISYLNKFELVTRHISHSIINDSNYFINEIKNQENNTENKENIKEKDNREHVIFQEFARRQSRIATECQKLHILQDDVASPGWSGTGCHADATAGGYKECIVPNRFPLARSASSMTCLINKVASTSIVLLFIEQDGKGTPSVASSPHMFIETIAAEKKAEFLFAKRNFFKFLVVRDPFERLLSAYIDKIVIADHWSLLDLRADIMKFVIDTKGYLSHQFVKVSSQRFNKNPDQTTSSASNNDSTDYLDSYLPSFQEFLEYILHSDLDGKGFASHWVPYWKWCAPCSMNYDVIAKLDSSPSELEFIWNRMNIRDKNKIPWVNKSFKKKEELESMKKLHYSVLSLKTISNVYKKFYLDFVLFDYDITDVLITGQHCKRDNCQYAMKKYFQS